MNRVDRCLSWLEQCCPPLGRRARGAVQRERQRRYWRFRTQLTIACPDNAFIPRVPDAGCVVDGRQVMHNGLQVYLGSYSYFPDEMHAILSANRGVHEPQEERAYAAVLPHIAPGGVILELGACWAFYSLWFASRVARARVFLIEGDPVCLKHGERNFQLNHLTASQTHAWVGRLSGRAPNGDPLVCVDDFLAAHQLTRVSLLHSDIQGAELDMLKGAEKALLAGTIDYLFISTHSDEIHAACAKYLQTRGYVVIASANVSQSYSTDGILVARHASIPQPGLITISQR